MSKETRFAWERRVIKCIHNFPIIIQYADTDKVVFVKHPEDFVKGLRFRVLKIHATEEDYHDLR